PDGIRWRQRDDGKGTSFKLEHLAEDNGLRQGMAHEALSDVRATIGLARLFREHQPRLWEYALRLRDKRHAASLLDTTHMTPLLHVSQRFPASRLCAAPVLPLARHPQIDSRVIVFDLDSEPDALLDLDAEAIAERLYIRQADLPEGESRIPLKEVHTNKCPALVPWEHLRDADFARLGIDPAVVRQRSERIRAAGPAIAEKVRRVYARDRPAEPVDVDAALYDGFIGDADKRLFAQVRGTPPHLLTKAQYAFRDPRLPELLFRYRARNWPESLLPAERERWNGYRRERLDVDHGRSEITFEQFDGQIAELRQAHAGDGDRLALLDRLQAWGREIHASLR
ncbi:MAG TPA: exodeoxyribonuclease I, partial [Thermomonas sp.]|nr:exodeoxyribonuclease I [Thermomonas sp.]